MERKEVERGIDEARRDEKESLLSLQEISRIHHDSLKLASKLQKLLVVHSRSAHIRRSKLGADGVRNSQNFCTRRKKARMSRKKSGRKRKVYK